MPFVALVWEDAKFQNDRLGLISMLVDLWLLWFLAEIIFTGKVYSNRFYLYRSNFKFQVVIELKSNS